MKVTDEQITEYCESMNIELTDYQRETLKRVMDSTTPITITMTPRMGYMEARCMLHILNALLNVGKE